MGGVTRPFPHQTTRGIEQWTFLCQGKRDHYNYLCVYLANLKFLEERSIHMYMRDLFSTALALNKQTEELVHIRNPRAPVGHVNLKDLGPPEHQPDINSYSQLH